MQHNIRSIRPFVGAKDFDTSRKFYSEIGFSEKVIAPNLSLFSIDNFSFYLQRYYAKEWIENSVIFVEVDDAKRYHKELSALALPSQFPAARVSPVRSADWGHECFLHDPSGVLWHFGDFNQN